MDAPTAPALSREPLPPRKNRSIFVRIVLFGFACVLGLFFGAVYVIATAPITGRILSLMGEQRRLMQEELTAPGASEVRKAGRCQQVTIMSPEIRKKMRALEGHRRRRSRPHEPPADETIITCMTAVLAADSPACDTLAREYVSAAHPTGPFRVNVPGGLRGKIGCNADYDSTGSPISLDGGI